MNRNVDGTGYPSSVTTHKGKYRLSGMELDFISLVAAGDDPMAHVVISKAAPEDKSTPKAETGSTLHVITPPKETTVPTINKTDLDPEVVAYIDGLEAEVDTLSTQAEEAETLTKSLTTEVEELRGTLAKSAPTDDDAAEEINKALLAKADPAVRALIEKSQADLKAATEIAKAEREQRLTKEYISKAEALPMLSEEKTTLAKALREVDENLSDESKTALTTVLKAANEHIKQSNLFSSFGTGGGETTVSKTAQSKADEIKKAHPELTDEQALAKVYEENPDLAMAAFTGEDA